MYRSLCVSVGVYLRVYVCTLHVFIYVRVRVSKHLRMCVSAGCICMYRLYTLTNLHMQIANTFLNCSFVSHLKLLFEEIRDKTGI